MNAIASPTRRTLFETQRHLMPWRRGGYLFHKFRLPAKASKVGFTFSYHKEKLAQLFVSLHSPEGFRGNVMKPSAKGEILLEMWVSPNDASEGGLVGPLIEGEWTIQLNVERLGEETDYHLIVYAEFDAVPESIEIAYPENYVVKSEAGWYRGELHAHSTESDGKFPVRDVIRAAQDIGLDFFSLTDHFTTSQWCKMAPLANDRTALIRSTEITSHIGHANLQGIKNWVNVYVDQPGWSMNQAADEVHAQGGLFCVNHAFSGDLCFRAVDFDWNNADLIEVYHSLEGCNNLPQFSFWDHLLLSGHRIVGVGGTDSHHPYEGKNAMGKLVTWIYADELSERGILAGLRRGRVYVDKGCAVRFTAVNASGQVAEMWETLRSDGQPVIFKLQVKSQDKLRLFIFKNGLLMDTFRLDINPLIWTEVSFDDRVDSKSYYRVELHQDYENPDYPGIYWRDHSTFRAASNPIFVA
jgi:hypothetical protein